MIEATLACTVIGCCCMAVVPDQRSVLNSLQGAALAEELTGLRGEVGQFSDAMARLQRQRADERSELLELQAALQVQPLKVLQSCGSRAGPRRTQMI